MLFVTSRWESGAEAVFVERRQPAVIVHQIAPLGSRRLPYVGTEEIGWMCILGAAPFAACGFFTYHGMTAEQVLWAWVKSEILCPKRKSEDLQKEDEPGTGRRARRLRAQENGCG